jgi:hypothetical protein
MPRDLVVVTDVRPGREDDLRAHLGRLDEHTGPLAALTHLTHFARFVVLPLDGDKLFFSCRLDGAPELYLAELVRQPAAQAIWAFCDTTAAGDPGRLLTYLREHTVAVPYTVAAWSATVGEVNAAVLRRAQLQRFAIRAAGLDPAGLAHAFRAEFRR